MKKISSTLLLSSLMFMLVLGIFTGWMGHKTTHICQTSQTDTVYVYDTVIRTIPKTMFKFRYLSVPELILDTVILKETTPVDTATILKDYFAKVEFLRTFEDSNLKLTLTDTVTQNKIIGGGMQYQLLQPQTVVVNQPAPTEKGHLYLANSMEIPLVSLGEYNYWAVYGANFSVLYTKSDFIGGIGFSLGAFPSVRVTLGGMIF